jgi:2-phospho-L-lactate/phosphoenolpyruvate guanylyltransferase
MRTAAILPVKRFAKAKRRLGASVGDPLRLELARAMVADVLLALAQTPSIERTIVVTREDSLAAAARGQGALVLVDAAEDGQSAAATLGIERALADGIERVLCIPGDCPALDPAELESLLGAPGGRAGGNDRAGRGGGGGEREVVIVPDRHGTGTNGLLLTPPDAIAPSFGPGSCERHRALAHAAGVALRVERPSSLLLDIDTGADLAALRARAIEDRGQGRRGQWSGARARGAHAGGADARALNTRAVLSRSERMDVPSITNAG